MGMRLVTGAFGCCAAASARAGTWARKRCCLRSGWRGAGELEVMDAPFLLAKACKSVLLLKWWCLPIAFSHPHHSLKLPNRPAPAREPYGQGSRTYARPDAQPHGLGAAGAPNCCKTVAHALMLLDLDRFKPINDT